MTANTNKKGRLRFIFDYTEGMRGFFLLAIVMTVFSIVFNFLLPQVIRVTIDSVIGSEPFNLPDIMLRLVEDIGGRDFLRGHIYLCALSAVLFAVLSGLSNLACRVSVAKFSEHTLENMRNGLFRHIQYLPYEWHVKTQTGDIIQRCTSDMDIVRGFISRQILELFRTVMLVTVAAVWMFSMDVGLTLVSLAFIPIVIGYSTYFFRLMSKRFQVADEAEGDLSTAVQENLTGVRVVRAFGRERHEIDGFEKKNNHFTELWVKLGKVMGLYWGMGDLATAIQIMTIIVLGTVKVVGGDLTLGEFTVFVSYNASIAWPIRHFGRILSEMSKLKVSLDRLKEIEDAEPETDDPAGLEPEMNGDIVFENVSFSYSDSAPLLKNIDFTVKSGTTVGILGSTGSGKSTLTYLLTRLYDVGEDCGRITIGGTDIRDMKLSHVRKNVGLVLQEPFLFSKSIADNIRSSKRGTDMEALRHAANIAALDDTIRSMPEGYDTVIGERGVTLSGGQKQRVAIARMLVQDTPIKIFDDSLSAVDTETDAKIRAALNENTTGSTVIIISHRITTLMHADQIIVMDDGKILEHGTHSELLSAGGVYKKIYDIQGSIEAELEGGEEQ